MLRVKNGLTKVGRKMQYEGLNMTLEANVLPSPGERLEHSEDWLKKQASLQEPEAA